MPRQTRGRKGERPTGNVGRRQQQQERQQAAAANLQTYLLLQAQVSFDEQDAAALIDMMPKESNEMTETSQAEETESKNSFQAATDSLAKMTKKLLPKPADFLFFSQDKPVVRQT